MQIKLPFHVEYSTNRIGEPVREQDGVTSANEECSEGPENKKSATVVTIENVFGSSIASRIIYFHLDCAKESFYCSPFVILLK
jgi:hypothetical protein